MKRLVVILLIFSLFLVGCEEKEKKVVKPTPSQTPEIKDTYVDNNTMKISFYNNQNNILTKQTNMSISVKPLDDITTLQIYPSDLEKVELNTSFANSFKSNFNDNNKIGFNIHYGLGEKEINYNILEPKDTHKNEEYLLIYLYDDYKNRESSWYSHIEDNEEYNYFTSIKFQAGGWYEQITTPINIEVFSYDSDDDFDNNTYRGNSKYTIIICQEGKTC